MLDTSDTIVARSTPPGRSALATIRISGSLTGVLLEQVTLQPLSQFRSRTAQLATFYSAAGGALDQVMVTFFPGPNSYTGEDLAEVSCHGAPVIHREILARLIHGGARVAEPGEFTYRAFLNGKLDLAQAEAVRDLIDSQTTFQARVAREQLEGSLSRELETVRISLVEVVSHLETALEFVEDDVTPATREQLSGQLEEARRQIARLAGSFAAGRLLHDGARVVLAGKPNSGKSSIFNGLLKYQRAIVTAVPGTTRDSLQEGIDLGGVPVTLVDTAGIREVEELVERIGVERALEHATEADLILFVIDGSREYDGADEKIWEVIRDRPYFLLRNKRDLPAADSIPGEVGERSLRCLELSALTGEGIGELAEEIASWANPLEGGERETTLVTNLRHYSCLADAGKWLESAAAALRGGVSEEFIVHDLRKALTALGEITGETTGEEILGVIFSTFCIGK